VTWFLSEVTSVTWCLREWTHLVDQDDGCVKININTWQGYLVVCRGSVMEWVSEGYVTYAWLVGILQVAVFEIQVTEGFLRDVTWRAYSILFGWVRREQGKGRPRVSGLGFVVRGWARVRALGSGKGRSCLGCLGVLLVTGNPLKLLQQSPETDRLFSVSQGGLYEGYFVYIYMLRLVYYMW
jgi:hypothetical protein